MYIKVDLPHRELLNFILMKSGGASTTVFFVFLTSSFDIKKSELWIISANSIFLDRIFFITLAKNDAL